MCFNVRKLRRDYEHIQNELISSFHYSRSLEEYVNKIKLRAIEDELIAYCRVFGKRVKIIAPEEYGEEFFENAIIFDEPIRVDDRGFRSPLLGICYYPEFDLRGRDAKSFLLDGHHWGLQGIISLSYLCGDEAECQNWKECGEAVLEVLRKNCRL